MTLSGWIQFVLYLVVLFLVTKPVGIYLVQVLDPKRATRRPFLQPILGWLERLCYRILRVDPEREQSWKGYAIAVMVFSAVSMLVTYGLLRLQDKLPLNPQQLGGVARTLAFNTAASFTTNTNWQSYTPETTMSYFSEMVALVSHNFFSAAVGICVAAALVRGIAGDRQKGVGNFWVDLIRTHLYVLLPICVVFALFLVTQGMIQNFRPYSALHAMDQSAAASTTQPVVQTIGQGPVASQVAIKMLGTNGGGFFNANAAHPFENPTPLSNFIQMLSIFLIPAGLTYYLGRLVRSQAHGWAVWAAMCALFVVGALVLWHSEAAGNPRLASLGIDPATSAMEGKEVRFGVFSSALFATITTDASCGAVNCMHDSLTPLGGLVPLFNMHMGELVFGGVGSGLYGILIFVVLAIFIAGLMVGRTPGYLGKKIDSFDVKCAALGILAPSICMLFFTAYGATNGFKGTDAKNPWGTAATNNAGPHGFSEIHYAYTSGAANNGSAFAGLTATPAPAADAPAGSEGDGHYNLTLAFDMLAGRFLIIIPILALAGHLAAKKLSPLSAGSFPVGGATFTVVLIGTIVIVGALTFLPALGLGPVVEHFMMNGSKVLY